MNGHRPEVPIAATGTQRVLAAVRAHACGEHVPPLYLAVRGPGRAEAVLTIAAAEARRQGQGRRLLSCTGGEFAGLWRDTLRRGLTPFVRRALARQRIVLVEDVEALRAEPFAQAELARLVSPGRLVILTGHDHLRHLGAWSPTLAACLTDAVGLCLHDGPCVSEADAWTIIDAVATHYGLSRATLLSRRRTATVALARQVAMYLLREEGLTYEQVGRLLRRDHSTAMHGAAQIRRIMTREPHVRRDLAVLSRQCYAA